MAGKLAADPATDWDDYFTSVWWDLDQHLAKGIAEYDNAVNHQISQITANTNNLKVQSANLRSNLGLLKPNWYILGGSWAGQCSVDAFPLIVKGPASLTLTKNGTQGVAFAWNGKDMATQTISISGKINLVLTFGLAGVPPRTLQGTFEQGYRQISMKMLIPNNPDLTATCNLNGSVY